MTFEVKHWMPGKAIAFDDNGIPTARLAATPCPDLLTEEEAARFLRLDETKTEDYVRSFHRIRKQGGIPAITHSHKLFFKLTDLIEYINNQQQENPR